VIERPLLAVTMGDPVGIGPEVIVKALSVSDVRARTDIAVYGDEGVLARASEETGIEIPIVKVASCAEARRRKDVLSVLPISALDPERFAWANPSPESDRAQLQYIERAVEDVLAGRADALVTAPISKASIARAGAPWPGHTEMLASLCAGGGPVPRPPVMMLVGERLRTVPLTVHVALRDVPARIDRSLLHHVLRVVSRSLTGFFGLERPRIAVAGLNPHAGEGGLFGDEEEQLIAPAIEEARHEGLDVSGPYPADTVFARAADGAFDVVVAMYHDQALIPIKVLEFDRAVNVTLGLPIIRTSVDHGTAYDIAGRGVASARSMIAALALARDMARGRCA